jgi:hypothetical protein
LPYRRSSVDRSLFDGAGELVFRFNMGGMLGVWSNDGKTNAHPNGWNCVMGENV